MHVNELSHTIAILLHEKVQEIIYLLKLIGNVYVEHLNNKVIAGSFEFHSTHFA